MGGAATGQLLFDQPTIFDHCTEDMAIVRDETFGPVLAVIRVDGAADAVRRVNRARYGLGASIWTRDLERAEQFAAQLEVGITTIDNDMFTGAVASLPWSCMRDGRRRREQRDALGTFLRPKALIIYGSSGPIRSGCRSTGRCSRWGTSCAMPS